MEEKVWVTLGVHAADTSPKSQLCGHQQKVSVWYWEILAWKRGQMKHDNHFQVVYGLSG